MVSPVQWEEDTSNSPIAQLNFSHMTMVHFETGDANLLGDVHLLVVVRKAGEGADDFSAGFGSVSQMSGLQDDVSLEGGVGSKLLKPGELHKVFYR